MRELKLTLVSLLICATGVYAQNKATENVTLQNFKGETVEQGTWISQAAEPKESTSFDNWVYEGWGVNFNIGPTLFFGDVAMSQAADMRAAVSLGLQKQLNPYLYWRFNGIYGNLAGSKSKYSNGDPANLEFTNKFSEINTTLKVDLLGASDAKVSPYLYAGVGLMKFRSRLTDSESGATKASFGYNGTVATTPTREVVVPVGLGLEWKVSKALSFTLDGSMTFVKSDKVDACVSDNNDELLQDMFSTISLGFVYKFGTRDCDKDGVVNHKDACPNTPAGVVVDEKGCPIDSDHDGIADYLDKCPKEAGLAQFEGCPDTDGDGVADKDDKCPKEAGLAQFQGCPDTDGDGIADPNDKCPKEAGLAQFQGCPDSDGDGVADPEDLCPNQAGPKEFKGCPDTDKDGIPDNIDKCPKVAGIDKNMGCPAVKKEVLKIFERALTGIQFETGKDVIKKQSFPILDQVVLVMKENPEYNLEINGHTDNVGDSTKNQILSDKRAASVRKYLIDKGIAETRMVSHGYGQTIPIADNKTAAGRAKNRRVEFKVLFQQIEVIEEQ